MFMQRLITSLILVPIVLFTLFYANPWILGAILLATVLLAGTECWQLIPLQRWSMKFAFMLVLMLALYGCYLFYDYWLVLGLIVWLGVCVAILTFPASQAYWGNPVIVSALCWLFIPLFMLSLMHLYFLPQGKSLVLYLLFLVWAADVGAYLFGKLWGRHKMIPQVSPGKSWEGLGGGFLLALIIATVAYYYYQPNSFTMWFVLAILTVIISVFGDLFVSILKRRCHLKDTGALIPGHGGVLDRLDSLMAALPVFYLGLTYISLGV
ncbi:MAG: phosphatidate cytidylyltransferase [Legionella sp.]|nr:MAG: phosphatidate cytidylyltransferase [Legionella sp.]